MNAFQNIHYRQSQQKVKTYHKRSHVKAGNLPCVLRPHTKVMILQSESEQNKAQQCGKEAGHRDHGMVQRGSLYILQQESWCHLFVK